MPTAKQIERAIELLEANGYDVEERADAEWEDAALAYRAAYVQKYKEEKGGEPYIEHFECSRPRIIAGLKAAAPLIPLMPECSIINAR